jgi:hypothetical protein
MRRTQSDSTMPASSSQRRRAPMNFDLSAVALVLVLLAATTVSAQKSKRTPAAPAGPMLTRTISRHDLKRFGYGGTITVVGAPQGSVTIEGWSRNEVEITAEIELHAESEEDLARLATVNTFAFDENVLHLSVLTVGTHDKAYMRRAAKDFPKRLLGLPWKINFHLRVPVLTDLEINAGFGPITLNGVEGAISLTATQTDAVLTVTGGTLTATIALGSVNLRIPVRSWRGAGPNIQLASGQLSVELPAGFNGDIDAAILRTGKIENTYPGLEMGDNSVQSDKAVRGRAGGGGATLRFTVGDGTIYLKKKTEE